MNENARPVPKRTQHATMQNYLLARHQRFANLMDEVPGLSRAVSQMCEAILRQCEERRIDPRKLKPRARVSPSGRVFIELFEAPRPSKRKV